MESAPDSVNELRNALIERSRAGKQLSVAEMDRFIAAIEAPWVELADELASFGNDAMVYAIDGTNRPNALHGYTVLQRADSMLARGKARQQFKRGTNP